MGDPRRARLLDLIRLLVRDGHHVSLGHSGATYEEALAAAHDQWRHALMSESLVLSLLGGLAGLPIAVMTAIAFLVGGVFALLVRLELLTPGVTIVDADTYNIGGSWVPVEGFKLRGGFSRAVRAEIAAALGRPVVFTYGLATSVTLPPNRAAGMPPSAPSFPPCAPPMA